MPESKKILAAMIPAEPGWRAVFALIGDTAGDQKVPIEIRPVIAWAGYNIEGGHYADDPVRQSFSPVTIEAHWQVTDDRYGFLGLVASGEEADVEAYEIAAVEAQLRVTQRDLRAEESHPASSRDEAEIELLKALIADAQKLLKELRDAYSQAHPWPAAGIEESGR